MLRSKKTYRKKTRFNKKLYIYLALITMAAVSLFAKPIKRGIHALNTRLRNASNKASLRVQLGLAQQDIPQKTTKIQKKKPQKSRS